MDVNECKRSAHIPAFGNWDLANQLPITQYFECATHRDRDLYALDFHMPPSLKKMRRKRTSDVNTKRQGKVWDVRPAPGKPNGKSEGLPPPRRPKPVDQDLYQIPPELLRTSKRSKMLGFISKCLLPCGCVS
ncbi:hypothetical protein K1719_040114 [Acacia pycnantha]|nr:hypothetical protein K1719_040114 [Acacia pycnantha]